MWVKDLILKLRVKKENELFKWRANFFDIVPKENFMEQLVKFLNKKLKKILSKDLMAGVLFATR